jgi:hypothetical protein
MDNSLCKKHYFVTNYWPSFDDFSRVEMATARYFYSLNTYSAILKKKFFFFNLSLIFWRQIETFP